MELGIFHVLAFGSITSHHCYFNNLHIVGNLWLAGGALCEMCDFRSVLNYPRNWWHFNHLLFCSPWFMSYKKSLNTYDHQTDLLILCPRSKTDQTKTRRNWEKLSQDQLTAKRKSELSKKVTSVSSLMCISLFVNVFFFSFFVPLALLSQSHDHSSKSHGSFSWGCWGMGLVSLVFGPECTGQGLRPEPCTPSYWHAGSSSSLPSRALTRGVCMSRQMGHR